MKLLATDDVADQPLADFAVEFKDQFTSGAEQSRMFFKSLDAPSWVRLIAELSWWQQGLAASATLYVAELLKEAAKDTWKSRAKAAAVAGRAAQQVKQLAAAVWRLKSRLSSRTEVVVCIPEPDEYFGAQFSLHLDDQSVAELELALFVHHLPTVSRLISEYKAMGVTAATGYFLELQDNASLLVWWFDSKTLKRNEASIALIAPEV